MDDVRLQYIKENEEKALNVSNDVYKNLLKDNEDIYNQQKKFIQEQENIQNQNLEKQLNFQKEQIEQQKQVAKNINKAESKKALNDYTSFTNPYGNNAESMAQSGLNQSGVSETSKLGGFNIYQNRLATANKAMQDAFVQYDNDLNAAILNNDVKKAEYALERLKMSLDYTQNFYNNKATISQNQLSNNQALNSEYYNRYQQEYQNIQNEKARAEEARRFELQMQREKEEFDRNFAYQQERDRIADQQWQKEYALSQRSLVSKSSKSSSVSLSDSNSKSLNNNGTTIKTDHYSGEINPDCQYGTFSTKDKNGINYQPNNVDGNKLSQAQNSKGKGLKVKDVFYGAKGNKGADLSDQKIYTTGNRYYTWDGSINSYIDITKEVNTSISKGTCVPWGV